MPFQQPALLLWGRQVVVRRAGQAGGLSKRRAAAWRPQRCNPSGRVHLPACPRHHSVAYGRTLLRASLACVQTAPGAGYWKGMGRL
jgi:hypothetical protein